MKKIGQEFNITDAAADTAIDAAWMLAHESNRAFTTLRGLRELQQEAAKRALNSAGRQEGAESSESRGLAARREELVASARENFEVLSSMAAPAMLMVESPFSAESMKHTIELRESYEREEEQRYDTAEKVLGIYAGMQENTDVLTEDEAASYLQIEKAVVNILDSFEEREGVALKKKMAMSGAPTTQVCRAIAEDLSITPERAKQILNKTLLRLQHPARRNMLSDGIMIDEQLLRFLPEKHFQFKR